MKCYELVIIVILLNTWTWWKLEINLHDFYLYALFHYLIIWHEDEQIVFFRGFITTFFYVFLSHSKHHDSRRKESEGKEFNILGQQSY